MANCDVTTKLSVTNNETIEIESKMRGILAKARRRKIPNDVQRKQFQSLIESYKDYLTDDIAATFDQVAAKLGINTNENIFFSKQGITNILLQKDPTPVENPPIIQDVEKATNRKQVRNKAFMLEAYKDATGVRQKVEKEISVSLVNAVLLNRLEGKAVNTVSAMNQNIRNYQQRLLNKIAEVIKQKFKQAGSYNRIPTILNNPVMYKNGQYTGAVEEVLKYDTMLNFTADQLVKFSDNIEYKDLLDAYNAKVILTHFDSLMATKYGKNIIIKNFGDGNFSADNKYVWASKGASMTDGFANPEEMMIEALIDRKMQELITSTPLLVYGSNNSNGYIQVSDFSNVIGRLKEFAWSGYDYKVSDNYINYLEHESTKKLAKQYSFVQMINRIREDGSIFLPAIFEILSTPTIYNHIKSTTPQLLFNFPVQYKQIAYSIYKGIFSDSGNSVNAITKGKLARTLYNEIVELADSIYIKKYMQYREFDNVITARDMSESNYDQNERLIRTKINTINSKLIKRFQNIIANEFDLKYENYALHVSKDGKLLGEIDNNGNVKNLAKFDDIRDLIGKVIGIPITDELVRMIPNENDNIIDSQNALSKMALRSLYLAWVNNSNVTPEEYITVENGGKIKKNTLGEIDLIHSKDVGTIQDLAIALSIQQGILSSSQVHDGFGNARTVSGLSYLIGSINSQLELQNKQENSVTKNSLYVINPGIFKGIYDSKEVITTNGAKTSTEWNVGEFISSSFIYDFIGGMIGERRELLKQGIIAILSSVNSDKNTISKLLVDLNAIIPQFNKTLGSLDNSELLQLINKEFGDIYTNIYNNVENDLNQLFLYHGLNLKNQLLNNFEQFNNYFSTTVSDFESATDYLRYLIREYNQENRENPIHLIDQVHYLNSKGIPQSNQTLFSLISRFNPQFLTEKGFDISKYPTSVDFWNFKAAELIQSLFAGKFNVDFKNETKQNKYLKESLLTADWIDSDTNQMIWAKVEYNGNKLNLFDQESEFELRQLLNISQFSDLGEALRNAYINKTIKIQLNPQIARYNLLDYFASQEHMIATVGSHIAHSAKGNAANSTSIGMDFIYEEAERYNAQHKRNVSFTAIMSEFTLGLKNGIPSVYNVAVIDDINDFVHTIGGVEERTKPFDGATFVNPFIVYLENNSLGASKVGLTKKQFVHAYDERTGTGVIIKTAGFAITNNILRNSKLLQKMMSKMTDRAWESVQDITKDEQGRRIIYGTEGLGGEHYLYYKDGDKYYAIRTSGIELQQDGRYLIPTIEIDKNGKIQGIEDQKLINIFSNYDLWKAFGGYNSMTMTKNGLVFGEESIQAVVEAMNNVGYYKDGKLIQPLKTSDIHYVATAGAVKQGAANINSKSLYYDDTELDFMKIKMHQAGVQLDKEHGAQGEELALMTQVISACAHLGYTAGDAMQIYNALYTLTEQGTSDLLNSFKQFTGAEISKEDFTSVIINNVFKQIAQQNVSENNLITTIASDLVEKVKKGKKLTNEEALSLPIDDNAIYNQFVSKLSVFLTDSGIRMKIPGLLAVLNPSYETIKLYGDRKLEEVSNMDEIQKSAPVVVNEFGEINQKHIKYGRTYKVQYKLPEFTLKSFKDGRFASTDKNGNIFYRETPVSVEEFFAYIKGLTTTQTSTQKTEVFRLLAQEGYTEQQLRKWIQTPEDVQKFILWHEMSHQSRPDALQNYYSEEVQKYGKKYDKSLINWLSENKIQEEYKATLDAILKIKTEKEGFSLIKVKDRKIFRQLLPEIATAVEDYTVGRNLGSYDATFVHTNGQTYSIWDLDSVAALYSIRDAKTIEDLQKIIETYKDRFPQLNDGTFNLLKTFTQYSNYLEKLLRRWTRHDIAMFSKRREEFFDDTSVWMDNQLINIDLNTVNIDPYELGFPKVFATEFGLDDNASVYEISHNPMYFTSKILLNIKAKVLGNNWDYCLKRLNGNHIYILDENNLTQTQGLSEVEITKINSNNKIFRTNEYDENIYQMSHENDRIFTDGSSEIIVTKNPEWYLDKMSYNILSINPLKNALNFEQYLNKVNSINSDNQGIQRYLSYLGESRGDWFNRNQEIESSNTNSDQLVELYNKLGSELWTSFMLTLNAVASRTPSQSMQSVMAMKIAFFDNENLNNAWVASDQFFLQGSDLDIDAVSIALYGVAKNGKVPLWSPYADYTVGQSENLMANIEQSLEFAFPTGKKVEKVQYQTPKETYERILELYNKYRGLFINTNYKTIKNKFHNNFSGQLQLLQELINDVNQNSLPEVTEQMADFIGKQIDPDLISRGSNYITQLLNKIENVVNRHNLYLNNVSEETIELIAKNYNMFKMFSITNDPINLLQSQSSVDSMTSTAKNVANNSSSAGLAKTRTPGNFVNKFESIRDNQVGKKGIGICAVGLKGFFGLTQYNNIIINSDVNALQRLKLGQNGKDFFIPRRGKTLHYDYLANINPNKNSPVAKFDPELYRRFKEKGFDDDAALQLSSLLSLATDNAKELALAKLNASDKTLGLYIYGLSIGMEFEDVASILMSDVGVTLTSVMEGNAFNHDNGIFNLDRVFDYFELGPNKLIQNNKIGFNMLNGALISGYGSDIQAQLAKYAWTHNQIPQIKTDSTDLRKALRQYQTYFRQVQFIKDNMDTYNAFKELYFGAEEMRHLGSIFGLNQGIKTKVTDIISKLIDIEKILISRADIINHETRRRQTRAWYYNNNVNRFPKSSMNPNGYSEINPSKMDLNKFIKNPESFIESYERIKHSFNILDAVNTVPHFRGYLKMLNLLDQSLKNTGHRYSTVRDFINYEANNNTPKSELERLTKKIEWFYGDYLRNKWMIDKEITFDLQNGARVFDVNVRSYTDKGGKIILGTKWGNASYKYYIENILIPQLQSDPQFKQNLFIKSLQPDITTLTVDNIPRVYLVTGINMMPSSEAERAVFNEYKAAFNSIADSKVQIGNKDISFRNALYLYSLIAHYGKQGRASLMPIFENQHNRGLVNDFHKYQSKFEGVKYTSAIRAELQDYIIPYKSPYQAMGESVIYWKNSEGQVIKWRKASYDELESRWSQGDYSYDINGYVQMGTKYSDEQVRNYDMNSTETEAKTLLVSPNANDNAKVPLIIKDGKFKGGKLDGIDVPYRTDPTTKQEFIDENEIRILLNKLDC